MVDDRPEDWEDLEARLAGRDPPGQRILPPGAAKRIADGLRAARLAISAKERAARSLERERQARKAAERRIHDLQAELKETHVPTARSDVVEGGVAGRPAIEAFRNVQLAYFDRHIGELPRIARALGREGASLAASKGLLADLLTLRVAEPRTVDQARRRDVAELLFADPVLARTLSLPGQAGERWRAATWAYSLRSSVEEATWRIFDKSAERSQASKH